MTKINPAEAVQHIPGFQLEENGYSFDTPKGRTRFDNCTPADECFGSDLLGILNVSKALRNVAGGKTITVPLDEALRRNISRNEYDHRVIKSMTVERRDEPILMLIAFDGLNVIDGSHRLKRRFRDKLADVQAYILRPETMFDLRVRIFQKPHNGEWTQTGGLSDEAMIAQVAQAKHYERMITGRP